MRRNTVIGAIIGIILIVCGGALFLTTHTTKTPSSSNTTAAPKATSAAMEKQSLKALMGMSGNQQCTFSNDKSGTTGTMYISSGKMHGDIVTKQAEKTYNTHMMSDGQMTYIWMDGQKSGFKSSVAAAEKVKDAAQQNNTVNLDQEVVYSCSAWSPDATKFIVPSEVTFTDFSGMMEKTGEMMQKMSPAPSSTTPNNQAACNACNNLPSDAQAQCRASLRCN